jgi:hypothetical protein
VHEPGAVLGADEVGGQHLEGVGRLLGVHEVRERRQIAQAEQLVPGVGGDHGRLFAEFARVRPKPGLGDDETTTVCLDHRVHDVGIDRDRLVGRQRPRRRRPDQ